MGVSKVEIMENGAARTIMDLTGDTVTPEALAEGYTAHNATGEPIHGEMKTTTVLYTEQTLTKAQKAQARSNIDAISQTELDEAIENLDECKIFYATCDTEAATAEKAVTVFNNPNWELEIGKVIMISFSITNTASNVTLNVNGTGAYPIWYNNSEYTSNGSAYTGYAQRVTTYMFNGTHWVWITNSYDSNTTYTNVKLGHGYATCSTAAATTAKVGTLSSYTLTTGGIVAVNFTNAVPANATLNINSKGAKAIYYRGAKIAADVIKAGDTATFIYNTYYHLISIDRWQDDISELREEIVDLNPLYGKKVSFVGDSICAGSSDTYLGGYGKIIADRNNMTYENLGTGGATITAETYSHSTGSAKMWISRKVDEVSSDADYVIVEGGVNDAWQLIDHNDIEIGEITEGFNAQLDDTTYYGAFESMLKKLVTRFQGKKIGYIAIPKTMSLYDSSRSVPNFYHIALECCAKWGVSVCDLNTISPSFEYLKTLGTEYTSDGTHPTYEGYLKYYCDPIEAWMKTLTTGGNNASSLAIKAIEEYTKGFNDAIKALQDGKLDNTGISFRKALLPLADGTTLEIDVLTAVDDTVVIKYINQVPISIDTDKTVFGSDYNGDGKNDGYLFGKRLSSSGAVKDVDAYTKSSVTGYIPVKSGDVVRIYGAKWATTNHAMNYICAYNASFTFIGGHATLTGTTSPSLSVSTTNVATLTDVDDNLNATLTIVNNSSIAYIRVSSCGETQTEGIDFANVIITVNEEIK